MIFLLASLYYSNCIMYMPAEIFSWYPKFSTIYWTEASFLHMNIRYHFELRTVAFNWWFSCWIQLIHCQIDRTPSEWTLSVNGYHYHEYIAVNIIKYMWRKYAEISHFVSKWLQFLVIVNIVKQHSNTKS